MRVDRLLAAFDLNLRTTFFPLHPDTPEDGLTLEQLFAGRNLDIPAAKARMARLMENEGLAYGERTMTYNSRLAQELAKWAETQPGGEGIHDAIFRAYFVDGLNIARVDVLVQVAEQVGLPSAVARDVLESRRYKDTVDSDWQRSRELGVTAVPTFVVGDRAIVGTQPFEVLEQFVREMGVERREWRMPWLVGLRNRCAQSGIRP